MTEQVSNIPSEDYQSQLDSLQDRLVKSEERGTRYARIAFAAICVSVLLVLATLVSLGGWSTTTSTLEQRNDAVKVLTDEAIRRGNIDDCQDAAFAEIVDRSLSGEEYKGGLVELYAECEAAFPR